MNLTVINIDNDLAKKNSVYIASSLAKNPNSIVNVIINHQIFKCSFTSTLDKNKIGISKALRDYVGVDIGQQIKVSPFQPLPEENFDLSFLELELTQIKPKIQGKAKINIDDEKILESLREKQTGYFFNPGEIKYISFKQCLYSVKILKSYLMMDGQKSKVKELNSPGKLIADTQITFKLAEGSQLILNSKEEEQAKNIFRPDFTMEDMGIGGLDEELFNIFRRTFASRRYSSTTVKKFGIKHVKGILLYGPPGTGKTLIARQLAKALNVKDLKIVNGPEIFSKFVGQSEENIRKLFAEARIDENKLGDKSPLHIIVFDEIDAICKQRGMHSGAGSQVTDQVVNQLLTNIDGVEALNNIIVIGMTNRKDLLDQAILRPGRFEVHVEVNLPNVQGREQILKIHTKNLRLNNLLHPNCKIDELARLTKNFTGAEIEALIKSASSHSISRTTNILDFSKELIINEANLKVEMQDFLKALQEVKPQFGVDEQKFETYFREKIINYGESFDKIMNNLRDVTVMKDNIVNQKRTVLLYGKPGTGKTMMAINFAKHTTFSYLKIICPENYVGLTDNEKIRHISKIFEDSYRTTNACIVMDNLQRLIDYSPIGKRFSNSILQALLLLLEKAPPKENCKLLIIATTSAYYNLSQVDLSSRFDVKIQLSPLNSLEIETLIMQKYALNQDIAKKISLVIQGCNIKNITELADLVDNKGSVSEWEFYWHNLLSPAEEEEIDEEETA